MNVVSAIDDCIIAKASELSLIAIHGLNGHAYGTWCSHESDTGNGEAMWLRDFLPEKFEQARVISYGYSSTLMGPNATVSGVKDFAYDLLQRLLDDRITDKVDKDNVFHCTTVTFARPTRAI